MHHSCAAWVRFFSSDFSDLNFLSGLKISATCTQTPLPTSCSQVFTAVPSSMKSGDGSNTDANEIARNPKESLTERTRSRAQLVYVRFFPFPSFHRPVELPLEPRCAPVENIVYLLSLHAVTQLFASQRGGVHPPPTLVSPCHWAAAPFFTNPCICHRSEIRVHNCFPCHTSKNTGT